MIPYVQMAEAQTGFYSYNKKENKIAEKHPVAIDINTASLEDWQSLPGINQYMAERIVKYRERTGGFAGLDQIRKTYGITDSVYSLISPYLKTDPSTTPKIDLNTANFYDLKTKANIPESVARAIIVYRQQYGPFTTLSDLKKIVFIKDSLFQIISKNVKIN